MMMIVKVNFHEITAMISTNKPDPLENIGYTLCLKKRTTLLWQ